MIELRAALEDLADAIMASRVGQGFERALDVLSRILAGR